VTLQAQKDLKVRVKNNETVSIGSNETVYIGGNRSVTIDKGDDNLELKHGNQSVRIKEGDQSVKLDMGSVALDVAMGNVSFKADLGAITLEAMQSITLKVGNNSITIDQTGVSIQGLTVQAQAQLMASVTGLLTKIGGDAMLTLKGGLTMLN
jgi:type VI secretion system secreted protein VgrG